MIPRHGAIRRPQSNHNRDKIGTAAAGSPDTEGPAQSGPALVIAATSVGHLGTASAGQVLGAGGLQVLACRSSSSPWPCRDRPGSGSSCRPTRRLCLRHCSAGLALCWQLLPSHSPPLALQASAGVSLAVAGLRLPFQIPPFLLALVGRAGGLGLHLPVIPLPALGLAGVGRGQAAVALVVPQATLLAALLGRAGGLLALPVIPLPALGLAGSAGVRQRCACRPIGQPFSLHSRSGLIGATQRPFLSRS